MCSTTITVCNQQYVQTVSINTTRIIKVTKNNKQTVYSEYNAILYIYINVMVRFIKCDKYPVIFQIT